MSELKLDDPAIAEAVNKQQNIVITEQDKDAFFRTFLNDEPFIQDVSLFGGKLRLRFKTLSITENDQLLEQIKKDQNEGVADETDHYYVWISAYRLALSLTHVNGEAYREDLNEKSALLGADNMSLVKLRAQAIRK